MIPSIHWRNLDYVRQYLTAVYDNYIFAASAIVCNYYNLDSERSRTYLGQVQTTSGLPYNQIYFNAFLSTPIYALDNQALKFTSQNSKVPALRSDTQNAQVLLYTEDFQPTIGDVLAFNTDLSLLLQRQSQLLFRVVGLEQVQLGVKSYWKLDLVKESEIASERQLRVNRIKALLPLVNKFVSLESFTTGLDIIDFFEHYSFKDYFVFYAPTFQTIKLINLSPIFYSLTDSYGIPSVVSSNLQLKGIKDSLQLFRTYPSRTVYLLEQTYLSQALGANLTTARIKGQVRSFTDAYVACTCKQELLNTIETLSQPLTFSQTRLQVTSMDINYKLCKFIAKNLDVLAVTYDRNLNTGQALYVVQTDKFFNEYYTYLNKNGFDDAYKQSLQDETIDPMDRLLRVVSVLAYFTNLS